MRYLRSLLGAPAAALILLSGCLENGSLDLPDDAVPGGPAAGTISTTTGAKAGIAEAGGAPADASDASDEPGDASDDGATADDGGLDAEIIPLPDVVLDGVTPATGSVEGGTTLTLSGTFAGPAFSVLVGGVACAPVTKVNDTTLTCITGNRTTREGDADVVVTETAMRQASKEKAFHYFCPWTWGIDSERSCGAAPPAHVVPPEHESLRITTFEAGHGYTGSGPGTEILNDTSDFARGTQAAVIQTTGASLVKHLAKRGAAPIDFTGKIPKVWIKIDNVAKANIVELHAGSSATDYFKFRIVAKQTQQWATEGDWVALSMPFGAQVGNPDRSKITDLEVIVQDDSTGNVTVHMNGISLVDEPIAKYPKGVVSFTFDDGYETQSSVAAPILQAAGFPGTAYLITELVGVVGPNTYMTADNARTLQDTMGWEIGVHSALKSVHASGYPYVNATALERDIVTARAWLIANDLHGYDHCAYPHGYFTGPTDVLSLVHKYFTSCRTIFSTTPESAVPSDAEKLRIYGPSATTTAATVSARIDDAVAHHEWLILVFHNFSPGVPAAGHSNDYSAVDFATIVDHVKSTGTAVKTVGQVLQD